MNVLVAMVRELEASRETERADPFPLEYERRENVHPVRLVVVEEEGEGEILRADALTPTEEDELDVTVTDLRVRVPDD